MIAHWCVDISQSTSDCLFYASLPCLQSEQHRALDDVSKSRWLSLVLAGINPVPDSSLFTMHKVCPTF